LGRTREIRKSRGEKYPKLEGERRKPDQPRTWVQKRGEGATFIGKKGGDAGDGELGKTMRPGKRFRGGEKNIPRGPEEGEEKKMRKGGKILLKGNSTRRVAGLEPVH